MGLDILTRGQRGICKKGLLGMEFNLSAKILNIGHLFSKELNCRNVKSRAFFGKGYTTLPFCNKGLLDMVFNLSAKILNIGHLFSKELNCRNVKSRAFFLERVILPFHFVIRGC